MNDRAKQTSLASINKLITGIARSAVKLNETIHATALQCMEHAKTFGDTEQCARLVDALPMSHRRGLLITWFGEFSPVRIAKKGDVMKGHLSGKADANKGDEGFRDWQMEAAKATPFYAMPQAANEPDVPTYESIHNNVVAFVKRLENRINGTNNQPGMPDGEDKVKAIAELAKLREVIAA